MLLAEVNRVEGWTAPEVLILTDYPERRDYLRRELEEQGHSVMVAPWREPASYPTALDALTVILIEMDDVSRLNLERIRALTGNSANGRRVVIVGAGDIADRVRLLNAGADLCLPSGLSDRELLARVLAVIRQAGLYGRRMTLREGSLTVDLARRAAAYRGRRLSISSSEYDSLRELALRVMETRSRFAGVGGDDRLTTAIRRLCDYAERLEESTQSRNRDRAHPKPETPEARRLKA